MKSTSSTKETDIHRSWHLIDAKGKILGRVASRTVDLLAGKRKPYFVPYLDCGDHVVVINAGYVRVTGKKLRQKTYAHFSGYPGGLKKKTLAQLLRENPTRIIKEAVSGMLPKNKLRDSMLRRLYIFADENHPYESKLKAQSSNVKSA